MRYDSPWIANSLVYGGSELGVLGSVIVATTATGANGPGLLYNDFDTGDENKQFRLLILTYPSAGTLLVNEDGTFSFTGPDGVYTWTYQLYVDGVATGSPATVTMTVGSGTFTATITMDDFTIGSTLNGGIASTFTASIVMDDIAISSTLNGGVSSTFTGSIVIEAFAVSGSYQSVPESTFVANITMDDFVVTGSYSSAAPSVFYADLTMDNFMPSGNYYSAGAGGLDPSTPLGKVRLKIGDYSDLPILPDAVIYSTLADCNNNVNRASQVCAQYVLGILTSRTHKRIAQLETWSGEQFSNYVQFLKLTVLNPNLTTIAPVPYAGAGEEEHPIKEFLDNWKDGYLPGSVVIPPQSAGRVIEYGF